MIMPVDDKGQAFSLANLKNTLARLNESRDDKDAWADLYTSMWPWVFTNIYRYLHGMNKSAEDASQDVFLRLLLYCKFQNVQDPIAFRAYLKKICKNVARNYRSNLIKRAEIELYNGETIEVFSKDDEEIRITLENALDDLDEKERWLIRLIVEGYSMQEIVEQTDWSYSNTAIRLYRVKNKVRNHLLR